MTEGVRGLLSDQVGFPDHCTAVQLREGVGGARYFASLIHYACEFCFVFDGELKVRTDSMREW